MCLIVLVTFAGHGVLVVLSRFVNVRKYEAQTKRLEFIEYGCSYDKEGYERAYVIDEEVIKCDEVRINYILSQEKTSLL